MAKVSRFVTVEVRTRVQQDDEMETEFGMAVDVEIPRGSKLHSHVLGVGVARAATSILDKLYFGAAAAYQIRKARGLRDAGSTREEFASLAGAVPAVDAVPTDEAQ